MGRKELSTAQQGFGVTAAVGNNSQQLWQQAASQEKLSRWKLQKAVPFGLLPSLQ